MLFAILIKGRTTEQLLLQMLLMTKQTLVVHSSGEMDKLRQYQFKSFVMGSPIDGKILIRIIIQKQSCSPCTLKFNGWNVEEERKS